jgi:ABC-type transport system substrate-binding protein
MKRSGCRWLALSSLLAALVCALAASGETRPEYGGTLRMMMRAAPTSLDPADRSVPDSFGRRNLAAMIFDTLVTIDAGGRAVASLADSWHGSADGQQWQLHVRRNVTFHDGSALSAESVAASLRFANPTWRVTADGEMVTVGRDAASSDLLAELALPRNAIVKRDGASLSGTGPFRIAEWQAGSRVTLSANENCWRGRPFLDGIEIELGKSFRDQIGGLQLGRADVVEAAPEQNRRLSQDGRRIASSAPMEFVTLVFARDVASADERSLRDAMAASVERGSMSSVLLQGAGQPAGGLLPTWISGYGFVFASAADLTRARALRSQTHSVAANWTLGYDGNDPMDRLLAERIALNAKDAGIVIQPKPAAGADLRLVRIPISSTDPGTALQEMASQLGLPATRVKSNSPDDLYAAEEALRASGRIIPLFHLPESYASAPSVRNLSLRADGSLGLADAWLETPKP